jgi:hypothetical protein
MAGKDFSLDDIFDKLPDVDAPNPKKISVDAKTRQAFMDITEFVTERGREPLDIIEVKYEERSLARKLKRIRDTPSMVSALIEIDTLGLLKPPNTLTESGSNHPSRGDEVETDPPTSIDDILDSIGEDDPSSIFTLRHVKSGAERDTADYIARRKPCTEFDKFRPLFDQVEKDLKSGVRKSLPFRIEQQIIAGQFFILGGLIAYIAWVGEPFEEHGKENARMRTIFSNGTEVDNLRWSLAAGLYRDKGGRRISDPTIGGLFGATATDDDVGTGTVYVLQSLSEHSAVAPNRNILHKIGVTRGSVQTRIANADKEATYLLAPVRVVAEFGVYNIRPHGIERLLHTYFDAARAEIELKDRFDHPVKCREWFFVSVATIKEAVDRLTDGTLAQTYYDIGTAKIVLR